jgi:hypothetical protein
VGVLFGYDPGFAAHVSPRSELDSKARAIERDKDFVPYGSEARGEDGAACVGDLAACAAPAASAEPAPFAEPAP